MPSFYNPGLQGLPPTPPHFHGNDKMEIDQPYYITGQSAFPPRYSQNGCDFIEQYSQANCFVKPAPMNAHSQPLGQLRPGRNFAISHGIAQPQLGGQQSVYGPIAAAPSLPPIRSNVSSFPDSAIPPQYRRHDLPTEHHRPKEEKPTGGVAAHLDYEIDQMSDFVAEMAQGMYAFCSPGINLDDIDLLGSVYPGQTAVPPSFRKYVHQILSSTRLPSSTILLGLFYLATRMRMLSSKGIYATGTGQVYRMLTTALLLGSKFLDDNTFQNRSWAEVSNIPVSELNSMELDWLFAFEWKIHERIHNKEDGFGVWLARWEAYRATIVSIRGNPTRQKLAPIDTNIARPYTVSKPLMSPDGPIPPQYQRPTNFENTWLNPAASEYSPPSAPHSGPNTPDYYNVGTWMYSNPPPPYTRSWMPQQQYLAHPHQPRSQPPSYHHTPVYTVPMSNSVWTGHGSSCGCAYCLKYQDKFFPANTFGAIQPMVAG
ncbi:uncharacterized protein TRUGW13939_04412 [Talaromyces rugulosus]|uniref:Cyclin N-terminal domain-containing protein n=1 Tax=Talaromyces rugulosus TaxID=121627 RepID=A0A7H8QTI4_TALRU|nr:uncharacterized protein TRUGW13939_04412 [Talaromyces rugulosus]QKX57300.1 hypothetical protein TRUGW13939_04412 [Talaromyces rugulosus]